MYKMFGSDLLINTQEQGLTVSADSSAFSSAQEMKHQIIEYSHAGKYFSPCILLLQGLFTSHVFVILPSLFVFVVSQNELLQILQAV